MATISAVGTSKDKDPLKAGKKAITEALEGLEGQKADFVLAYSTVGYDQSQLLKAMEEELGDIPLCGCSSEGIIAADDADESDYSLGVIAVSSNDFIFRIFHTDFPKDFHRMGEEIASSVNKHSGEKNLGLFIMGDGLSFQFDQFMNGLVENLLNPEELPVFGGLSGDNFEFKETFQYSNGKVTTQGICAFLVQGKGSLSYTVSHGCQPIGKERIITRCEGNRLYELDGRPTMDVFREYVPEEVFSHWDEVNSNLSLGFKTNYSNDDYDITIRGIQEINVDEGYISLNSERELIKGDPVWMTHRDTALVSQGVMKNLKELKESLKDKKPAFVLNFDCCGRGKLLFSHDQKQVFSRQQQHFFGRNIPWLGFYSYGEICPIKEHTCFHNYTGVFVLFMEN